MNRTSTLPLVIASLFALTGCISPSIDETSDEETVEEARSASVTAATYWTQATNNVNVAATCAPYHVVDGMKCTGSYCGGVALRCVELVPSWGRSHWYEHTVGWTSWFSEEGTNWRTCPADYFVTGIQCSGSNCDDIFLRCTKFANITRYYDNWRPEWFSEENGGTSHLGSLVSGLRCQGSYCDNMNLYTSLATFN